MARGPGVLAVAAALAAVAILVVAPWADAGGASGPIAGNEGPPSCSVVAGQPWAKQHPGPRRAELWVDCDYHILQLRFASNRDIASVGSPQLYRAGTDDRLTCSASGKRAGVCTGSIASHVRVRIGMRMRKATCGHPSLRVQVDAFGGADCPPGANCPAIGFESSGASGRPLGCSG